jgi:hypothetical protein
MGKEAEYRSFAALCLEVATKTTDTADNARLLANAEAWLDLADRVTELAKRSACKIADHPLVLKTLGIESDDVVNYCFPTTWPADRERRARYIGEWLKTESRYLA